MIQATCISEIRLTSGGPELLGRHLAQFASYAVPGGFAFARESEARKAFLAAAAETGTSYVEYWHAKADPGKVPPQQLFQFFFQDDREYDRNLPPVWETYVSECNERNTRCTPFVARPPLVVDPGKSKKLDLLQVPNWQRPRIFQVSTAARDLLESMRATGIEFRECEFKAGKRNAAPSTGAQFHEMVILDSPSELRAEPAGISADQRCRQCSLVNSYVPSGPVAEWLAPDDSDTDFRCIRTVTTPMETFELGFWRYFASARVLAAMKKAGLKGFRPMASPLGIEFIGVFRDIEGTTSN